MAISTANDENDFIVMPNPTNGAIQILFKADQPRNINVVNMLGEILYSSLESSTTLDFNLSGYAKGIYFISVIDKKGHKRIKKIIKD